MIGTTIDQSRMLMDLGLPLDSADMCWHTPDESYFPWMLSAEAYEDAFLHRAVYEDVIPAWSLAGLMEVMPDYIDVVKIRNGGRYICLAMGHRSEYHESAVDAVVEMAEWMCEKGYLGKEEEK